MAENSETRYSVTVAPSKAGMRLDRFLAGELGDLTRTRIKALVEAGQVCAQGAAAPVTNPAQKVHADAAYDVIVPVAEPAAPEPQAMDLDVVYEDDAVIVINKPRGLVVHPAAGNPDKTLVNALLAHCGDSLSGIGGVARPGIVHRLDKDTSGLIIAAKTDAAHQSLSAQLKDRSLSRIYQALVWGVPNPPEGVIEGNIGRSPKNRKKMAVLKRGGKEARTHYEVLESYCGQVSLVECRLETGRTHQIRVHLASIGHPIIGDPVYGGGRAARRAGRGVETGRAGKNQARAKKGLSDKALAELGGQKAQLLHAGILGFTHPTSGSYIKLHSDKPNYFNGLIKILGCE